MAPSDSRSPPTRRLCDADALHPADERKLSIRLDAARAIYNACLGESLRRLDLMRQSKAWQTARALPATVDDKPNKARSDAFRELQSNFSFDSGSIQKFGERCRDACWIGDHLKPATFSL